MRKKINNTRLLLVFAVLLVLVVVLFTNKNGQKERSFNKQLLEFNSEEITDMILFPKSMNGESIEIKKEDDIWLIKTATKTYHANNSLIDGMVSNVENLKAKSLVANSKDRWENYEVNDSLASRVQIFNGKKKVADVYIGKFKFSQPQNMSTYVRLDGKKETFKVDGYLAGTFNRKINELRDKTVIDDQLANWSTLSFDYPADSSFILSKSENKWWVDGVLADSIQVVNYINSIKNQSGNNIVDGIGFENYNEYQLTIERDNLSPIIINAKQSGEEIVLQSTENEEAKFNDVTVLDKIFVSKLKFEIK